jgi:hypothetical protein
MGSCGRCNKNVKKEEGIISSSRANAKCTNILNVLLQNKNRKQYGDREAK